MRAGGLDCPRGAVVRGPDLCDVPCDRASSRLARNNNRTLRPGTLLGRVSYFVEPTDDGVQDEGAAVGQDVVVAAGDEAAPLLMWAKVRSTTLRPL